MGSPLASPHYLFLDPLVEDLALLVSLASLGIDLVLPLVATSVVEVVLEVVLGLEVIEVVPDLILEGSGGGNTCCLYGVAWVALCPAEVACCWMAD